MEMLHPQKGRLTFKAKRYQAIGNKSTDIYSDENGQEHELDGTEIPEKDHLSKMDMFANEEKGKQQQQEKDSLKAGVENLIQKEEQQKEEEQKQAEKAHMEEMHTDMIEEIKNSSEAIVEAVKAIPETVIPEFPDHYSEQEKWQNEVLEVLKKELPEADYSPIVEAIKGIKYPEIKIPENKDYTEILEAIKKALPENTDLTPVVEAIKAIPQFQIPENLINEGRIKVEVDRISLGGGSGSGVESDPLVGFQISDKETDVPTEYYGYVKADGSWYIMQATSTTHRYVKGFDNYETNYANRASLTYDYFHNIF